MAGPQGPQAPRGGLARLVRHRWLAVACVAMLAWCFWRWGMHEQPPLTLFRPVTTSKLDLYRQLEQKRVTLDMQGVSTDELLAEITRQTGVPLTQAPPSMGAPVGGESYAIPSRHFVNADDERATTVLRRIGGVITVNPHSHGLMLSTELTMHDDLHQLGWSPSSSRTSKMDGEANAGLSFQVPTFVGSEYVLKLWGSLGLHSEIGDLFQADLRTHLLIQRLLDLRQHDISREFAVPLTPVDAAALSRMHKLHRLDGDATMGEVAAACGFSKVRFQDSESATPFSFYGEASLGDWLSSCLRVETDWSIDGKHLVIGSGSFLPDDVVAYRLPARWPHMSSMSEQIAAVFNEDQWSGAHVSGFCFGDWFVVRAPTGFHFRFTRMWEMFHEQTTIDGVRLEQGVARTWQRLKSNSAGSELELSSQENLHIAMLHEWPEVIHQQTDIPITVRHHPVQGTDAQLQTREQLERLLSESNSWLERLQVATETLESVDVEMSMDIRAGGILTLGDERQYQQAVRLYFSPPPLPVESQQALNDQTLRDEVAAQLSGADMHCVLTNTLSDLARIEEVLTNLFAHKSANTRQLEWIQPRRFGPILEELAQPITLDAGAAGHRLRAAIMNAGLKFVVPDGEFPAIPAGYQCDDRALGDVLDDITPDGMRWDLDRQGHLVFIPSSTASTLKTTALLTAPLLAVNGNIDRLAEVLSRLAAEYWERSVFDVVAINDSLLLSGDWRIVRSLDRFLAELPESLANQTSANVVLPLTRWSPTGDERVSIVWHNRSWSDAVSEVATKIGSSGRVTTMGRMAPVHDQMVLNVPQWRLLELVAHTMTCGETGTRFLTRANDGSLVPLHPKSGLAHAHTRTNASRLCLGKLQAMPHCISGARILCPNRG